MAGDFDPSLDHLTAPALRRLSAVLASVPGLTAAEARVIHRGAAEALEETVRRKVNRVLLLELNAARISGRLTGATPEDRWREWKATAATPEFWRSLTPHYPTMRSRLAVIVANRCAAAEELARRFAADRADLAALPGAPGGDLTQVRFGAGDSHRGGRAVAVLHGSDGRVVYKPRSLAVDRELARLIARLAPALPHGTVIRVPEVLSRLEYGWAEHIAHRYCAGDAELRAFYRGIGHWLALMRLVGGSDLHAENLIAAGPAPVVVDCETLFTPHAALKPSGHGAAVDRASELLMGSVLRIGLLPGRGAALGWRGVDVSALGALPGQQPHVRVPVVVDAGTDTARVGVQRVEMEAVGNHPSPDPVLARYWDLVLDGFAELSRHLDALDRRGDLGGMLAGFADLPVRVVPRATEAYAELARMLWHPGSLHDEAAACREAARLLTEHAGNQPGAPPDPKVIDAEVTELLNGDIPFFATTPARGRMDGPGGTAFGEEQDLIADALRRWRERESALDRDVIRAALVSAYLNEGWLPRTARMAAPLIRHDDLDPRRRRLAAGMARRLLDAAVRGDDGTVTWIAPVLTSSGWSVQSLTADVYGGAHGVAITLAAYAAETARGEADEVPGLDRLLADLLHTIRLAEDDDAALRRSATPRRPDPPGGYVGIGSWIWSWLLLGRLGAVADHEALTRACALAGELPAAVAADEVYDLLGGMAGAVVPLLRLAGRAGDARYAAQAGEIGERLVTLAADDGRGARWPNADNRTGLGGMAHGSTGIGWALARLSDAGVPGAERFAALADRAFLFEESLYDADGDGWLDLRETEPQVTASAWCHGAGGIGVVAADLLARRASPRWQDVLRRAAASCWKLGMGWNHTLCHGDLGNWEVLDRAVEAGLGPGGLTREHLYAYMIGTVEEHGPITGLARDAFAPGLLPGMCGILYQLLRARPGTPLPSVLLPDPGA
ncbi:lanthionine synthetase [Sphaerisporangium krabiense]|uniref:Type 2 lantibiotic biosynthesis protein LanM n=1 Tax=Sphaerisporangium krabiense TaxID=763782 RepID=A0A7W8Z2E1_9ACTN|nr:type 2 lanthipeptide synthetase LanM family protein [Sphaerisporangium krabiense]MBB5626191.1 type 2 lantibiotic biosynthesis protein LanM [Sphaerisporangium krabiense]GII66142.1 lanthionine synthetase [Sphaerisporangium krabiense]